MSKYECLIFPIKPAPSSVFPISVNGNSILPGSRPKNLSVILNISFSFTPHVQSVSKSSFKIYLLLTTSTATNLVQAIVTPPQDCCNHLLLTEAGAHATLLVVHSQPSSPGNPLKTINQDILFFCSEPFNGLPISFRVEAKIFQMACRTLQGLSPTSTPCLSNFMSYSSSHVSPCSSHTGSLLYPLSLWFFALAASSAWGALLRISVWLAPHHLQVFAQ